MDTHPCRVRMAYFAVAMCLCVISKRARDVADIEEPVAPQKRQRNCAERGVLRQGVAQRILRLDTFVFK